MSQPDHHPANDPEPLDAWSARLVRQPMGQAPADLICLRENETNIEAEKSSAAETLRRKGRLGQIIELDVTGPTEFGPALTEAIARVQSPLVVLSTARAEWNKDTADRLFKAIDSADLAVGVRPAATFQMKFQRTVGALLRGWFWGAGVSDPLSPYLIARAEGLKKFPLQSKTRFAWVEMVAKWNFLDALIHEEPLPVAPPWSAPIYGRGLNFDKRSLFQKPRFHLDHPENAMNG